MIVFILGVLNVMSNLLLKWGNHDGYSCIIGHCTSWYKRDLFTSSLVPRPHPLTRRNEPSNVKNTLRKTRSKKKYRYSNGNE